EYKGATGAWRFGKMLAGKKKYDLFFCLPDSLSSAIMARATGSAIRIGFKKEARSFLLTNAYKKKSGVHRVQEYIDLLEQFTKKKCTSPAVELLHGNEETENFMVININSEASSRRLPQNKAVQIISAVRKTTDVPILLIGSPKEQEWVDAVYHLLPDKTGIKNLAGQTNMLELISLMSRCKTVLTTDSGPAHVSNALGINTLVLFGAGNENNTAPFNKNHSFIIRLGKLKCEPCTSNICKRFAVPECLLQLDEDLIAQNVLKLLSK
ncbi:MAG: glycosyltransferase family 9 protein, partial [Ginsengibacter sp.]